MHTTLTTRYSFDGLDREFSVTNSDGQHWVVKPVDPEDPSIYVGNEKKGEFQFMFHNCQDFVNSLLKVTGGRHIVTDNEEANYRNWRLGLTFHPIARFFFPAPAGEWVYRQKPKF